MSAAPSPPLPRPATPDGRAAKAVPADAGPTAAAPAPDPVHRISLGLQGGGSHGAFTWGVLDSLLADPRVLIEGLSGTSAGAVNAVALASGHALQRDDPATGARDCLAQVWQAIGNWGGLGAWQGRFSRELWGAGLSTEWLPGQLWAQALGGLFSPYQLNPLNINPLSQLLGDHIDFDAIRRAAHPHVFVSATHVSTGKAVVFAGAHLDARAVMASACLPTLFQAVEIDGQSYWDGGYAVNPALSPLIASCTVPDIVVVQINPLIREERPETANAILDRMNELTFNASLLTQMRAIDRINRMLAQGLVDTDCGGKPVRLHRIDGGQALLAYKASSKTRPDPELIQELFEIGHKAGREWLHRHLDDLGQRSTVDVGRDYEDDTRIDWPQTCTPAGHRAAARGFRPWLGRVLGRREP